MRRPYDLVSMSEGDTLTGNRAPSIRLGLDSSSIPPYDYCHASRLSA